MKKIVKYRSVIKLTTIAFLTTYIGNYNPIRDFAGSLIKNIFGWIHG